MPGMTWITDCSTLLATTHSQVTTANPTPSVATVSAVRRGLRPRAATASRSVGPADGQEEGRYEAQRSGPRPALEQDRRRAGDEAGRQCDVNEAGGMGRLLDAATTDHRRGRRTCGAPGGQHGGKKRCAESQGRRDGKRAPAHDEARRWHGELRSQRGGGRDDGQHEPREANSRGEARGYAG